MFVLVAFKILIHEHYSLDLSKSKQRQGCYERFTSGEIDRDTFIAMKSEYTAQIDGVNSQAFYCGR